METIETFPIDGLTVNIHPDSEVENPADFCDNWKPYSFNSNHVNYKDPDGFLDEHGNVALWLRNKLRAGTAFWLGYYEHGACQWNLSGEHWGSPWDSISCAGLLLWEHPLDHMGARTPEDRRKDARGFLESYTAWCNGWGYGYSVEDDEGETLDSCWGYFDEDYCKQEATSSAQWHAEDRRRHRAEEAEQEALLQAHVEAQRFEQHTQHGVLTS